MVVLTPGQSESALSFATGTPKPSPLTRIPREIQQKIIQNLKFFDLARLQMTFRHMRGLPTDEIKRVALKDMEQKRLASVFKKGSAYDQEFADRDIQKLRDWCACYTCLLLKNFDRFEDKPRNRFTGYDYVKIKPKRKCIGCLLESTALSLLPSRRIMTLFRYILICRKCGETKEFQRRSAPQLLVKTKVCDDCFSEDKAKLASYREAFQAFQQAHVRLMSRLNNGAISLEALESRRESLPQPPEVPDLECLKK